MRQFIIIIIFFAAAGCGSHRHEIKENRIVGRWTEHWGKDSINPESDVAYVDTITMTTGNNGLEMRCAHNSNYLYDQIMIKGDSIFFRMKNTSVTQFDFFINYQLKQIAKDRLEGRINNSQHETVGIVLKKLPAQ
jgi:hypothetical protein